MPHKVPKKSVRYGPAKNLSTRCGNCRYFQGPNSCRKVLGVISKMGWCKLWRSKANGGQQ